jgi:hypothetical protein
VVSSPGGTTDLQTTNSFGDKSDLFVGEDTDKGGKGKKEEENLTFIKFHYLYLIQ